jgi:hypothetical protein
LSARRSTATALPETPPPRHQLTNFHGVRLNHDKE